jgi:hypothetical protein
MFTHSTYAIIYLRELSSKIQYCLLLSWSKFNGLRYRVEISELKNNRRSMTMIEALHDILTSSDARDSQAVQTRLEDETSAGTPWFN